MIEVFARLLRFAADQLIEQITAELSERVSERIATYFIGFGPRSQLLLPRERSLQYSSVGVRR